MAGRLHVGRLTQSAGFLLLLIGPMPCRASARVDTCASLRQRTEQFAAASANGNTKVMDRLLDERVTFVNEDGGIATKAVLVATVRPPVPGVTVQQSITHWHCEVYGDIAVARFIDDQMASVTGVDTRARFQSVETWRRTPAASWRMISSETIALQDDPVAVDLPRSTLQDYVGNYIDRSGDRFTFSIRDGSLMAAVNGGPATPQKAEVRDVLFTPGRARFRKVFQRDGAGRVVSFAYRREGHDTLFTRIS